MIVNALWMTSKIQRLFIMHFLPLLINYLLFHAHRVAPRTAGWVPNYSVPECSPKKKVKEWTVTIVAFKRHSTPFPSPELCLTPLCGLQAHPRHLCLNQSPRTNAGSSQKTSPAASGSVPASSSSTSIPETYGIWVMTGLRWQERFFYFFIWDVLIGCFHSLIT